MILTRTLVALDIETTGTWIEKDKIIEIGMIKHRPDAPAESYVKRINPGIPISPAITELTGIAQKDIKSAPRFNDIAEEVLGFIGNHDIAGFNVERFDLPILEREIIEAGFKFERGKRVVYDAQKIYHMHEKRTLAAAYRFYCGKGLDNAHSAMDDAQATFEILNAQVQKYGSNDEGIESLKKFEYDRSVPYFDRERKFRWWNGSLYPVFGKFARKKSIKEIAEKEPSYLKWILEQDFTDDVKKMIKEALDGRFPEPTPGIK